MAVNWRYICLISLDQQIGTNMNNPTEKEAIKTLLEISNYILQQHPSMVQYLAPIFQNIYGNSTLTTSLLALQQLASKANMDFDSSWAGERMELEKIVRELDIFKGFVVDIAASDGFTQSCTLGLFGLDGWAGLAVEMDATKFYSLAYIYSKFKNVRLARTRVTPSNVVDLLKANEVPYDFDVLNLDIDSYDLYVIKSLLLGKFRPKIITMEINEKIPPGIYFTVDFDEEHYWQGDHFFGCSIDAATEVVKEFGYILFKVQYNNAIFIRNDIAFSRFQDQPADNAYLVGYKNQLDRKEKFPWNADVDYWIDTPSSEVITKIAEYFHKYTGKFTLRSSKSIFSKPQL